LIQQAVEGLNLRADTLLAQELHLHLGLLACFTAACWLASPRPAGLRDRGISKRPRETVVNLRAGYVQGKEVLATVDQTLAAS
jgi:hypothetical protein